MARVFLTARWVNLILVNYRVPPELLLPYVPIGSELDTPDDAPDTHLVSLVAFHFADTAAFGIPIPGAGWFPELNLRFYVRRGEKRATVFLREFVPNALITLGARWLYHQPYYLALIQHYWRARGATIDVSTHFTFRDTYGSLRVQAENSPVVPPSDSQAHFLKEHYWGFDRAPSGESFRYRVAHPLWRTYPVLDYEANFDPGSLLGGAWRGLAWQDNIHSVLCVEGSSVKVYTAESLTAP
jgi:uncharacterized protein YqjF (DUF2071 family)